MDDTMLIEADKIVDKNTKDTLHEISVALEERGYDPVKQIAGYIISGDPGYISNYKECRNRILKLDRTSIVELMLNNYLK